MSHRPPASIKSLHRRKVLLGLAAAFIYDLFLFVDTVLFRQFDAEAYGVRGVVHALVVPLLAASTARIRDWTTKLRLSQKAVFHSATLTMVGGYLLFMAAVGYYVGVFAILMIDALLLK